MRRGLPFLLVLIVVLATATGAQAIVYGQPDGARHPFVGLVFQVGSDAGCSGTLISPTVFVTAGHCTDNFIINGTGAPDVQVTFASDARAYASGNVPSVSGTPHTYPGFCSNDLNYHGCPPHGYPLVGFETGDLGVVVLDTPVVMDQYGQLPAPGEIDGLPQMHAVTHVGYGFTAHPQPGDFGLRSFAPAQIITSNGPLSDEFLETTQNPSQGTGGMCTGDSGGPVLDGDSPTVLATHSFVYSTYGACNGVSHAFRLDQPAVLSWIRSWITN